MDDKQTYTTGTVFEERFGYARAVRKGDIIKISGTVAVEDGEPVAPSDPYEQASFIIDRIEKALTELGGELDDVIQTRVYVEDFDDWKEIGKAHRSAFADVQPANTTIQVETLVDEDYCLEIDAEAIVS